MLLSFLKAGRGTEYRIERERRVSVLWFRKCSTSSACSCRWEEEVLLSVWGCGVREV